MGDQLKGRRCKITITIPTKIPGDFTHTLQNQLVINGPDEAGSPGLRVVFHIVKTSEKEPNTNKVTVYNLAESTRHLLQTKGMKLMLEAGYQATGITRLFEGDVRFIDHVRKGGDWETELKCGDGERGYKYARLSESYAPGTVAGQILKRLAQASGLAIGNVGSQAAVLSTSFDAGYAVSGPVMDSLHRLVKSLGYTLSIQDGALQILGRDEALEVMVPLISPTTGLIGSPEMGTPRKSGKPALCKFTALLTPTRPGSKVHLQSERYDGLVTVQKCEFVGDTYGGSWYTHFQGSISQPTEG